jgi:crotonobetainyl-CoA:carnitine CoA-transferase CaiB-like acyl-CoA transferase
MTDAGSGPLAGVTVIELASFISGPLAGMMLADLGADVIKVEPPRGDPFRRFGRPNTSMSPMFANVNRGKRCLALDLKAGKGRAAVRQLLRQADVMICNWRPSVAARLGLADDALAEDNPDLIRVYISGYGPDGPMAEQPTFDSIIQARLAFGEVQGDGDTPSLVTGYVVDKTAAAMVGQAVLAALVGRYRTGRGARVEVAMLDAGAYLNFPDGLANRTFIDHQPREARNRQLAGVRPIRASDGWLVVAPVTADQIRRACAAVDRSSWADEILAISDGATMTATLFDRVETVTREGTVDSWLARFARHDVPVAPCFSIDQHLADPQVVHNQLYSVTESPELGAVRQVRYPAVFSTWGRLGRSEPPPTPGQHTTEILNDLPDPA